MKTPVDRKYAMLSHDLTIGIPTGQPDYTVVIPAMDCLGRAKKHCCRVRLVAESEGNSP